MRPKGKRLDWRLGFAVGTLVYVAWVLPLGLHDFEKVHRVYRQAAERLHLAKVEVIARQELIEQCKREAMVGEDFRPSGNKAAGIAEPACLSWPAAVLEQKQRAVTERLIAERSRAARKLGLFYFTFVVIFLVLPPLVMYLWLVLLIRIFRSVKAAK